MERLHTPDGRRNRSTYRRTVIAYKIEKLKNLVVFIPILYLLNISHYSCRSNITENETFKFSNDTTLIIRSVLDHAFSNNNIPDFQYHLDNTSAVDTIFILNKMSNNEIDIKDFMPPNINDFILSVQTEEQICQMYISQYLNGEKFPKILEFITLEKEKDGYIAGIKLTCIGLEFEDDTFEKLKLHQYKSIKCRFGMMCGGGFLIEFKKIGNRFESEISTRWFD